jgi:hypothetical protein
LPATADGVAATLGSLTRESNRSERAHFKPVTAPTRL